MALIERIQKDLTTAMMAKDELRLSVLRMVKSALKYKEVEKVRPLEDAEALQVLQTLISSGANPWSNLPRAGGRIWPIKRRRKLPFLRPTCPRALRTRI